MAVSYDHLKGIRSPIPSGPAHETAVTARLSSWAHTYTLIQEVMTAGWNLSRAIGAVRSHMVVLDHHLCSDVATFSLTSE